MHLKHENVERCHQAVWVEHQADGTPKDTGQHHGENGSAHLQSVQVARRGEGRRYRRERGIGHVVDQLR